MIAGNIKNCIRNWQRLTSCPWTLETVLGCKIPLLKQPKQLVPPHPFKLTLSEQKIMDDEIVKLHNKGVIKQAEHLEGEFISNIFLRPKPNGTFRLILDLTKFNDFVKYEHFKMFSLTMARQLITKGAYMASIDLKDAYYYVPIASEHRKYLRFVWRGTLYEYTCLPNGLASCPRIFTRLLKPIFATLGERGHILFPYIDDSFIVASSKTECAQAITELRELFVALGFSIHEDKSVLTPTHRLKFLGFYLDSSRMMVEITEEKVEKFTQAVDSIGSQGAKVKIRTVAGIVGLMTAYGPAVLYGGAHIKTLERCKNDALRKAKGDFEKCMRISPEGWEDINWWQEHIACSPSPIVVCKPKVQITTDASLQGWGAHSVEVATGGRWLPHEAEAHINVLELRAVLLGLSSLIRQQNIHVHILSDNMTAVTYITKMGGTRSTECNNIVRKIWCWAEKRNIWLTASYIKGKDNQVADHYSRHFHDHLEWELNSKIYEHVCSQWGTPTVDLFASRHNYKCERYVSWHPEPEAWRVDAFSLTWDSEFYYAFPPFSLVARVARKLLHEKSHAVLIAPEWTGQPWLTAAKKWACAIYRVPRHRNNLRHRGPLREGGDVASTPLLAFLFSGKG